VACALGACAKQQGTNDVDGGARDGAVIARVGNVELHEDDLERMLARDPSATPTRLADPKARRELVDGLVRFELLAQAAERAGLTRDPDAIHAQRQIAVTKLVNRALGAAASPDTLTRAEVEREYLARQATEYTRPPAVEVRHIHIADAKLAESVANEARRLAPDDDSGFGKLVSERSEDTATRSTGGQLGFIDRNSRLPSALVEAALKLTTPGEVTGPIDTGSGYEILRLVTRRAAAVSPLSSVEEPLRQELYRERRVKALEAYLAKLKSSTKVELVGR
jgi:peptidyl-prolyl cis-trans isomerase C